MSRLFVPCNEDGQRQLVEANFWDAPLHIWSGDDDSSLCEGITCLIQADEQAQMIVYR